MERISGHPALTPKERRLANEYRLWIRVITISDLVPPGRNEIPYERLTGQWRADTPAKMTWPNLPQPTKEHCAAFRRCIRHVLCTKVNPYRRNQPYPLDESLGQWFPRERNTLYDCYATDDGYIWRDG